MTLQHVALIISISAFPVIAWSVIAPEESAKPAELNSTTLEIRTIHPRLYESAERYSLPATLEAAESVDIFARANGYMKERHVDIGSEVRRGQLLARLSSPELEDLIHQAKADIRKQKSLVSLAKRLAQRYQQLKGTGVVSIVDVEEKISDFEVARAVLTNYEARLEQLNEEYAYTEIRAPFSGIITHRFTEIGQRISASDQKPLFTLNRQNELKAVVYIPQSMLNKVNQKTGASLIIDGSSDTIDELQYLRQSSILSSSGGTMRVEFMIRNTALRPGMTGEVKLQQVARQNTYVLPLNTIRMVNGKPTVQIFKDGNVTRLPVNIDAFMTNDVRVSGNLSTTQKIIINPNALLEKRSAPS